MGKFYKFKILLTEMLQRTRLPDCIITLIYRSSVYTIQMQAFISCKYTCRMIAYLSEILDIDMVLGSEFDIVFEFC